MSVGHLCRLFGVSRPAFYHRQHDAQRVRGHSLLVLDLVLQLKARGDVSIILIAHNYGQVFEVCDRINFLSAGKIVYDAYTRDTSVTALVELVTSGYKLTPHEAATPTG